MLKFLCGIALGFAVGLIIAPAPGEDTRRQIVDKAQDLAQAPQRKANELLDQVPERAAQIASDAARQAAEQAVGKVREKTGLPETGTGR